MGISTPTATPPSFNVAPTTPAALFKNDINSAGAKEFAEDQGGEADWGTNDESKLNDSSQQNDAEALAPVDKGARQQQSTIQREQNTGPPSDSQGVVVQEHPEAAQAVIQEQDRWQTFRATPNHPPSSWHSLHRM